MWFRTLAKFGVLGLAALLWTGGLIDQLSSQAMTATYLGISALMVGLKLH